MILLKALTYGFRQSTLAREASDIKMAHFVFLVPLFLQIIFCQADEEFDHAFRKYAPKREGVEESF